LGVMGAFGLARPATPSADFWQILVRPNFRRFRSEQALRLSSMLILEKIATSNHGLNYNGLRGLALATGEAV